jgi:hypothetical protein
MAVPQFLSSAFTYLLGTTITDVQTIINDLYTLLIGQGWTCTGGGSGLTPTTMLSPVRSDRIRFKIVMTRSSATSMTFSVYDDLNVLINAAAQTLTIDVAGNNVHYCVGPLHCYVLSMHSTTVQCFSCGVLDNFPHSSLADPRPQYFVTSSVTDWDDYYIYDVTISAYTDAGKGIRRMSNWNPDQEFITVSGAYMFTPLEILNYQNSYLLGRVPHMMYTGIIPSAGDELVVPIDTAVLGIFIVAKTAVNNAGKHLIRKT